jgi:hypothetical protein
MRKLLFLTLVFFSLTAFSQPVLQEARQEEELLIGFNINMHGFSPYVEYGRRFPLGSKKDPDWSIGFKGGYAWRAMNLFDNPNLSLPDSRWVFLQNYIQYKYFKFIPFWMRIYPDLGYQTPLSIAVRIPIRKFELEIWLNRVGRLNYINQTAGIDFNFTMTFDLAKLVKKSG